MSNEILYGDPNLDPVTAIGEFKMLLPEVLEE